MKVELNQVYIDCDKRLWQVLALGPDEGWDLSPDWVCLVLMVEDSFRTRRTLIAHLSDPEMYRLVPGDHTPWWSNLKGR